MAQSERRASPRIGPLIDLTTWLRPTGASFPVLDLSVGGFAINTSFELPQDARCTFEFCLPVGTRVPLRARLVHSEPDSSLDPPAYRAGFVFMPDIYRDQLAIRVIVDAARAAAAGRGGDAGRRDLGR